MLKDFSAGDEIIGSSKDRGGWSVERIEQGNPTTSLLQHHRKSRTRTAAIIQTFPASWFHSLQQRDGEPAEEFPISEVLWIIFMQIVFTLFLFRTEIPTRVHEDESASRALMVFMMDILKKRFHLGRTAKRAILHAAYNPRSSMLSSSPSRLRDGSSVDSSISWGRMRRTSR